ncbi:phage tail tape measure protein [Oceanobacillus kimchii]|uniref:phage tail tape measure protein n=1 Tax=Oceanobacillus kimchii TaxID=746691 RepID=UPI0021A38FBC|nr:phage tail tape measure protein [Oceanobacillus kimchii]MCT1577531.1 phage tail tape measure protein [Oceanobacillus kimchii]MCT2136519.1 phage tail tape measure protein [Oceanobacillus kimchii]
MQRIEGMSIEIDLETMKVNSGLTDLKSSLKTVNSEMKANMSAFDRGDKSVGKYETRLKGLNKKLELQRDITDKAKTSYEKMVAEHGEGSVEAEKAAREYNNQSAALNNLERYVNNATDELERMKEQQRIANSNWTKMGEALENTGGKLRTVGTGMKNVGSSLTRNVTMPLSVVGGLAIKTGMDFEAGMSKVGAVSGASADDMEKLEAKAREMGSTTVFSAKEASDAFYYMSLAGWDATQMMDGISGVMDLAAASGEDLGAVSDIVTDGLTAFGLAAEDSARMADVLAAASSNANTDVNGLGNAFKYAAPVAGALGYSIEDTSKAIGLMANAGIKGEKAGTALRTMMTNLTKPTNAMKKEMDKLGISITDGEGEMRSFDDIMGDLRTSLGGLSKDQQAAAAATIFGKEAMSGALAIVNASEDDYKKLSKAIQESDGVAGDMADTMQDNLAGSLKELRSMVEDLFIETYQNLKPALEDTVEVLKDVTRWFANLSPEAQQNIIKFGLLAAAAGPVLSIFGQLTVGTGFLMQGMGALSKSIGVASGTGTAGKLAILGKAGVAGLAIAGIAGVTLAVIDAVKESKELEEVNLDVANSLHDQAEGLEKSAETFDKLSSKAKISNDELATLNDLNKRISESSNPGEINELQKQYDNLAKKSGLSKDELKKLWGANDNIISQAPEVQTSVSETGNKFAENTDAVKEYIDSLYESSRIELEAERTKQLENEKKIRDELAKLQDDELQKKEQLQLLLDAQNMTQDEIRKKVEELSDLYYHGNKSQEERNEIFHEIGVLQSALNEDIGEEIQKRQDALKEVQNSIASEEEKLEKVDAINQEMANIILKQAGINEEGEKGLAQLDETLVKNQQELSELDQKLEKNGVLNEKDRERRDTLQEIVGQQRDAKNYIFEELGLYNDLNSLINTKLDYLSQEQQQLITNHAKTSDIKVEEGNILDQLKKKNEKRLEEREQLMENWKQEGANKQEIQGQIDALDQKILNNDNVIEQTLRESGLWDDVKDQINFGRDALIKQGAQIDENNNLTSIGIGKEKERTKEAGEDVTKNVDVTDNGTINALDLAAKWGVVKPVEADDRGSIRDLNQKASSPVDKVVNFISKFTPWATGTPASGHPGGNALLGDGVGFNAGSELVTLPNGKMFLSADKPTIYPDLPKGTHVMPARKTKQLLKSTPKYAEGTDEWEQLLEPVNVRTDFTKLLALLGKRDQSNTFGGDSRLEQKIDKLMQNMNGAKPIEVNQELHFHSTEPSPSELARKYKQASRELAMEWRG